MHQAITTLFTVLDLTGTKQYQPGQAGTTLARLGPH